MTLKLTNMNTSKIVFLIFIVAFFSCKNEDKKQSDNKNIQDIENQQKTLKPLEDLEVINVSLIQNDPALNISNIAFSYEGAEFDNSKGSYIQTDSKDLNLNEGIGISVVFNFNERDGAKAQTLISLVDENSATGTAGFTFYISNRRITGVVQGNYLWGNGYTYNKGMSDVFFDSPQLELDKFYSLTINIASERIELFVNNELYQIFNNINVSKLLGDQIVLGAFKKSNDPSGSKVLKGKLRNLEIYNRTLTSDEIDDYFLINQSEMNEQNDAIDLQLMEQPEQN